MIQNDMNIIDKLREYQFKLYKGDTMKLKDLRFECHICKVHFTPSEPRAKRFMEKRGVINECNDCEREQAKMQ